MTCKFDEKTRSELADAYGNNHMDLETRRDYLSHVRRCGDCEDEVRATLQFKANFAEVQFEQLEPRAVPSVALMDSMGGGSTSYWENWPPIRWGIEDGGIMMF